MHSTKSRILNTRFLAAAIALGAICSFSYARDVAAEAASVFKTRKSGTTITCGLVNGAYVPGAGSAVKFVSSADALKALAGKTDSKSKAKAKKLKAYLTLSKRVCKSGPPSARPTPTPGAKPSATPGSGSGSVAAGQQVFTSLCSSCHSVNDLRGRSASQMKVPGMPALTDQQARDLAAYANK